ncbi:MAG: hypothetical protein GY950_16905, partial [bacterium]|nr:hypothetical protein [bacterium]
KKYKGISDSIFNEKNSRRIAELQNHYENDKQEKEIALLKKDKQIQKLELVKQTTLKNSLLIVSSLVLILAFVIFTRYRLKLRVTRALRKEIEDRKKAEAELLKSQKLESIGILAGGIAHDFNNLLAVIIGTVTMAKDEIADYPKAVKMLDSAEKSSLQATELIQKLITFSKGGWFTPQPITLSAILTGTADHHPRQEPLLQNTSIPPDLAPIYGDERQLRQVMHNLLQNADEATGEQKKISIKAENISLNETNEFSLEMGDYVKVVISDNGRGIPPDHIDKIFDPYFSTKNTVTQKGMGLGLAICYSIIKKHNGHIAVTSEVGKGTTVDLYFPAVSS